MYDDDSYPQHMDDGTDGYDYNHDCDNDYDNAIDYGHPLPDQNPEGIHGLFEDLNLTDEENHHISELLKDVDNNEAPEDVPEEKHSHDISFGAGSSSCADSCWNTCAGTCSGSCMVKDY